MAGIYETDDEEGGQAPLVPLPTSRRPSRIAVAQYLSLAAGVVLVLAGLLMTLRDECPPGTVKIVRGASVVDDAAGTLSIASFVSPLLSLSARSSLECTPRMRVTVDIRTVPSEPPSVACANQLVCPALSQDGRGGGRRGGAGVTARASNLGGDQRGQARPLVLTSACGSGISSLSFDGSLVRCGTPPRQPPAATASCSGEALLELRLDGHCSFSTVEAERVLEWLEQYEQRMRPSGAHDIVRMPARDFVGSEALPANGDNMFTAEALVQSLPSWFQVGYNVRHLSHLVLG